MPIPYDRLKQALLAERAALTKELDDLNSTIKEEAVGYSTHPADDGTTAFDQERDLSMQVNVENTLQLVSDALARFENGTYGLCQNCGQEIDAARLAAIPYAPLCLSCQSKSEHR
jgi:RNA polymerase-binding transcription factor DksA